MADTDTPSADHSIDEHHHHPISAESCKKARTIADTTTTRSTTTNVGDFISGLPDAILCDILSYIPTKHAVATSVLSKRWNRVWTSVPNLDFSSEYCPGPPPVNETHFMNFVDNVLSLNNVPCVRRVYVHCNGGCDSSRVNAWISVIASRDTQNFDLKIPRTCLVESLDPSTRIYSLPDSFFTRTNLVELSLKNIALKVPTSVHFPCLQTISLDSMQLLDDDSMKNLLSGCPAISTLSIDRGGAWDNAQTLYICSSTLHDLSLYTQYCNKDFGYKVVIDAPNVKDLTLTDEVDADYEIINLLSLVKVEFGVELEEYGRVETNGDVFNARLFELLRKISHVEDLHFATGTMRSFTYALLENVPIFNNLTCMRIELVYDGWSILPYLFHCAPNLVTFILEKVSL